MKIGWDTHTRISRSLIEYTILKNNCVIAHLFEAYLYTESAIL
mgnify:CR=1 FL=1